MNGSRTLVPQGRPGRGQWESRELSAASAYYENVCPEDLLDRVAGKHDGGAFTSFPRPEGRAVGKEAAIAAARKFRENGGAFELLDLVDHLNPVGALGTAWVEKLSVPASTLAKTVLVLPAGFTGSPPEGRLEAFIFPLRGSCRISSADGHCFEDVRPGEYIYLPAGTTWSIDAEREAIAARIELQIETPAEFIGRRLASLLRESLRWSIPPWGLRDSGKARPEVIRDLEDLVGAYRQALDGIDVRALAFGESAIARQPPPPPKPTGPGGTRDDRVYDDYEWGVSGFQRRCDDIFIVTYQRSGTTWMQMVLFQLLTDGDLGRISHIYEFSPYPHAEMRATGSSRRIAGLPSPRVIKTHWPLKRVHSKIGRYIYIARSGLDVAISSYYHHLELGNDPLPFSVFFDRFMRQRPSWFGHIEAACPYRNEPNVLFLFYHQMVQDLRGTIRQVAKFIGVEPNAETERRAMERCQFSYMKSHEDKFHHTKGVAWLSKGRETGGFIRQGGCGAGRSLLSAEQLRRFESRYQAQLGALHLELNR